jgi:hypothetical protein
MTLDKLLCCWEQKCSWPFQLYMTITLATRQFLTTSPQLMEPVLLHIWMAVCKLLFGLLWSGWAYVLFICLIDSLGPYVWVSDRVCLQIRLCWIIDRLPKHWIILIQVSPEQTNSLFPWNMSGWHFCALNNHITIILSVGCNGKYLVLWCQWQ